MIQTKNQLIVALDTMDLDQAIKWVKQVTPYVGMMKIGLELFSVHGIEGIKRIQSETDLPLVLDLKLYDIPSTVYKTIVALAAVNPAMLTIHASGGLDMIATAGKAKMHPSYAEPPAIICVTLLTSMTRSDLVFMGVDARASVEEYTCNLGSNALRFGGGDGLVCSPREVKRLRELTPDSILVTPGVRPVGANTNDQQRVATPGEAIRDGASYIVVGRPITQAKDPGVVAADIAAEIRMALTSS